MSAISRYSIHQNLNVIYLLFIYSYLFYIFIRTPSQSLLFLFGKLAIIVSRHRMTKYPNIQNIRETLWMGHQVMTHSSTSRRQDLRIESKTLKRITNLELILVYIIFLSGHDPRAGYSQVPIYLFYSFLKKHFQIQTEPTFTLTHHIPRQIRHRQNAWNSDDCFRSKEKKTLPISKTFNI